VTAEFPYSNRVEIEGKYYLAQNSKFFYHCGTGTRLLDCVHLLNPSLLRPPPFSWPTAARRHHRLLCRRRHRAHILVQGPRDRVPSRASPWRPSDLGKATYNPFRPISNHPHWFPYGQDHQHAQFQLFPMGHKSDLWHSRPSLSTSVLAIDTSRTWPGPYMSRALHVQGPTYMAGALHALSLGQSKGIAVSYRRRSRRSQRESHWRRRWRPRRWRRSSWKRRQSQVGDSGWYGLQQC